MEQQEYDKEARLIDRYIDGSLTGIERQDFIDRMDMDIAFRDRVVFRNLLSEGIRFASDEQLKEEIVESINYHKPFLPFGLRMLLVFLGIITVGVLLFNYVGNDKVIRKPVITFKWFTGKKDNRAEVKSGRPGEARPLEAAAADSSSLAENSSADTSDIRATAEVDSLGSNTGFETMETEIVVKKDQLIFSASLVPKVVTRPGDVKSTTTVSLAEETARKLNPPADLPESEVAVAYDVEFWISPVNYHGYRMILNEIQLYGIEQPEKARLYKLDKKIFLRYGSELYEINPADQFQAYRTVKDNELLNICR